MHSAPTSHTRLQLWKFIKFTLGLTVFLLFIAIFLVASRSMPSLTRSKNTHQNQPIERLPDPEKYTILINQLQKKHSELHLNYLSANDELKEIIIAEARDYLEFTMPQLMQCWIGTPWDFNGTSQTPGKGKIACGYFVSVILRDAGFKVNRISLAQQASQNIITSVIRSEDKKIAPYKQKYNKFLDSFKAMPNGIYIIGLDTHVGYLIHLNEEIYFCHSGGSGVIKELPNEARDIERSNYRVVGNITNPNYVIEKWLLETSFPTKR